MHMLLTECSKGSPQSTTGTAQLGLLCHLQAENVIKLSHRGMAVMMPHAPSERKGKEKTVTFDRQAVADTIKKVRVPVLLLTRLHH